MVPRRPSSNRVYPTGTFRGAHVRTREIVGLSHLKEMVAVDRGYRDGADLVVALDAELDEVAGAARPELLVKLFLGGDRDTVDLQDPIALAEPGARRGSDRGELADEETRGHGDGVETEPRPRRPAGDPPGVDQLVLHRHELLDGDREVHVWGLAEPERRDPDQLTPVVHDGAAAPLRARWRDDDRRLHASDERGKGRDFTGIESPCRGRGRRAGRDGRSQQKRRQGQHHDSLHGTSPIQRRASAGGAPAPRRPAARTTLQRRASAGGAPAPRRPAARTTWVSDGRTVARSRRGTP